MAGEPKSGPQVGKLGQFGKNSKKKNASMIYLLLSLFLHLCKSGIEIMIDLTFDWSAPN